MNKLARQALDLHSRLARAYWEEVARRDEQLLLSGDPLRIARLERLKQKAAIRYRRRLAADWETTDE